MTLGLLHIVYAPYGPAALERFLDSYRQRPAGVAHDLILVFKGFAGERLSEAYYPLLDGLTHRAVFAPDGGFDLGTYFFAARRCEYERLCFLNSSSVLLADDWLAKLCGAFETPGVGLAGATGSLESHITNLRRQFRLATCPNPLRRLVRNQRGLRILLRAGFYFPSFPNVHLRTNAFVIDRRQWLTLWAGPFRTKQDCYDFESGRRSLTRQVQARGLEVRIVGRDGRVYLPAQWYESETFRAGTQRNLLVADNQTRQYLAADAAERRELTRDSWGVTELV